MNIKPQPLHLPDLPQKITVLFFLFLYLFTTHSHRNFFLGSSLQLLVFVLTFSVAKIFSIFVQFTQSLSFIILLIFLSSFQEEYSFSLFQQVRFWSTLFFVLLVFLIVPLPTSSLSITNEVVF